LKVSSGFFKNWTEPTLTLIKDGPLHRRKSALEVGRAQVSEQVTSKGASFDPRYFSSINLRLSSRIYLTLL
jgi:hypothetical protein